MCTLLHFVAVSADPQSGPASVPWEMATPVTPIRWGMSHRPDVILVHGLWHQPAHFDRLTAVLRAHGIGVHVPRLHRGSLTNDTAAVQSVVDALPVPPVVLGHSYGGSVITGLDRVRHLVYVAAFVPAVGENGALLGGTGALVNDAVRRNTDGTTSIPAEHARGLLYADCTESLSAWASGLLVPQQPGHGRGVPQRVAWTNVESTYVKCVSADMRSCP
ncbi:alpha/beta hydrolase [Cryobacterium sp. TMT1-66-1]|nr:alpha/beta hydrolase [Cryobacterium sp. TMT1-66-1]